MHTNQLTLTEGSIWKGMLLFALPVFFGNLFQQLYNAFDAWVVGRFLGDTALAAVSSSGSLIFMMVGFFNGVAMGAGAVISRYYGARDYDMLKKAIHTVTALGFIAGIALSAVGVVFTPTILRWMRTPEDVLPQSITYFRYYSYGAVFVVLYNVFVGILHAVGDSRHPLYYLIASTLINVVLDLVFVGVFRWGVGSAAMATTVSQGISALLCCIHLLRSQEVYRLEWKQLRIHRSSAWDILRVGFPSGVQNSVISIANVFVQSSINTFGAAAMAGCGANSKLEGFVFLPVTCFTQALATFVGQNLGAHRYDRVKKGVRFGLICCMLLAETIGVISYILAPYLIGFFNNTPEVVDYGVRHMRTMCLFYCFLAFSHCIAAIMRGAGRASVPMYTMLLCWCLIRVSYISLALKVVNQLETVSWAYPITWTCSSIIFLIYFLKVDWMHSYDHPKSAKA
ncbi:MAG: MATE family efflux transporter [Oscillospiraceae bacterium]|nr:MATE family efflux transporter [Oscillospiraceae bacterium]